MAEKYIAVGDIHGCLQQLEELLEEAARFPDHQLIFLGDYIDRGPDSNEVLTLLRNTPGIKLLGNHEESLIDAVKSDEKTKEFLLKRKGISEENLIWLQNELLLFYETEEYIFVHAGLDPENISERNPSVLLWTGYEGPYSENLNKLVVHGHMCRESVIQIGNSIGVDTMCSFGGYLSAIVLPEKIILKSRTPSENYARLSILKILNEHF